MASVSISMQSGRKTRSAATSTTDQPPTRQTAREGVAKADTTLAGGAVVPQGEACAWRWRVGMKGCSAERRSGVESLTKLTGDAASRKVRRVSNVDADSRCCRAARPGVHWRSAPVVTGATIDRKARRGLPLPQVLISEPFSSVVVLNVHRLSGQLP